MAYVSVSDKSGASASSVSMSQNLAEHLCLRDGDAVKVVAEGVPDGERAGSVTFSPTEESLAALEAGGDEISDDDLKER